MKQPVKMVKTAGDLVILLKDFKANSKIVGHPLFIKKQVFFQKTGWSGSLFPIGQSVKENDAII